MGMVLIRKEGGKGEKGRGEEEEKERGGEVGSKQLHLFRCIGHTVDTHIPTLATGDKLYTVVECKTAHGQR